MYERGRSVDDKPNAIFGLLTIFDVICRSIPPDDLPGCVLLGHLFDQEPVILAIGTPDSCFVFEWFAGSSGRVPFVHEFGNVVRVEHILPAPTCQLFQRRSRIFAPSLIYKLNRAVRQSAHDQSRNRIDDGPELERLA